MGFGSKRERSRDWPYEDADPLEVPVSEPAWRCLEGSCQCHPAEEGEPLELTVLLCDERARSIPHARCRVLYQGRVLNEDQPNADAEGWLSVIVRAPVRMVTLEWAPPDIPLVPRYPFRKHYHVEIEEEHGRLSLRRRLHNLGFSTRGRLEDNVKEFQRAFDHEEITGDVEDIRHDLIRFHDEGGIPPLDEGDEQEDEQGGKEDGEDRRDGGGGLLAFPTDRVAAKPKKPKKKPKKDAVERTPPPKKNKPAGGLLGTGTGTARPPVKGTLTLTVSSLFAQGAREPARAVLDPRRVECRWDSDDSHPVAQALVELFDAQHAVVGAFLTDNGAPRTNALGQVKLKIATLRDGTYVLRLNPPEGHELRGALPGPVTDPAVRSAQLRPVGPADAFFNDPRKHTRFRFLEIEVTIAKGALTDAKLVRDMLHRDAVAAHGAVARESQSRLLIDWRPDWVQCGFTDGLKKPQADPSRPENTLSSVQFIVLHHNNAMTPGSTITHFSDALGNKEKAGAHYLVDVDGHVLKMAHETVSVRHAGPCFWYGLESSPTSVTEDRFNWNNVSVGIEHVHKDQDAYLSEQVVGTKNLIERIRSFYKVSPHNVLGHSEIALHGSPNTKHLGRKLLCPGEAYDWYILESTGNATRPGSGAVPHERYDKFFLRYPKEALNDTTADSQHVSRAISGLQTTLSELGYFVNMTGKYDEPTIRAVEACQVRYFSGRFRKGQRLRVMSKRTRLANLITIQMMHDVLAARAAFKF
jgi:N-acetylmuramoyl-L-alanine amidase